LENDCSFLDSDFTWNLGRISEKEAFKLYYNFMDIEVEKYIHTSAYEYLYELRQYDTLEGDYLDWDMTDSKYYNKGYQNEKSK